MSRAKALKITRDALRLAEMSTAQAREYVAQASPSFDPKADSPWPFICGCLQSKLRAIKDELDSPR